jgi:hypothetical protein
MDKELLKAKIGAEKNWLKAELVNDGIIYACH